MEKNLTQRDYEFLAELRYQIRRFERFSEQAARDAGLEPRQHQLLLAIKGMPSHTRPRIAEIAQRLQVEHHSVVELANRLEVGGLLRRERSSEDRRVVHLQLTPRGEKVLRELTLPHLEELHLHGPALLEALQRLVSPRKTRTMRSRRKPNNQRLPPESATQRRRQRDTRAAPALA